MNDIAIKLLDEIYDKLDRGRTLSEYENGLKDALGYLVEQGDKPEIEN